MPTDAECRPSAPCGSCDHCADVTVGPNDDTAKKSAATLLVEMAEAEYQLGVTADGEAFAVPRSGPKLVAMLRGSKQSLRARLARHYFSAYGRAPAQQALADALLVIEGMAQDCDETPMYQRVAEHDRDLWLDLGDGTGEAIRITSTGWTVEADPPVMFRRTALTGALPRPERGGNLSDLFEWLNVTDADRPLVLAWLVASFFPDIPHPVLALFAEAGRGKSTAMKLLVSLTDPSPAPIRKSPRDPESWVTAAAGSWVVAIDNLSDIREWLSDSICRAVTGDGDVRRRLYTDGDLSVFAFKRCVMLSGIDVGSIRGDLADRLLPLDITPITDADRREERDMWPAWEQRQPAVFGALLDLVASVASVIPSLRLDSKPRLADFARVLAAVDQIHGTDGLGRFISKQGDVARESLTDDPFVTAVADRVDGDVFEGTSSELLAKVCPDADGWKAPKGWPGTARQVTMILHRQAPAMRKAGWTIADDGGANKSNAIRWTIAPPEIARIGDSPSSPPSPNGTQASQASQASNGNAPSQDVFDADAYEADHPDLFGQSNQ